MKAFLSLVSCLSLAFFTACHVAENKQQAGISSFFNAIPAVDTMRFEVSQDDEPLPGDTIPNVQFLTEIGAGLMQGIDFLDDSGEAKFIGRSRFPLNEGFEAYLVDVHQNWFKNQSLFLFDQKSKKFSDRVTVAEWYGGDGGQILTGSWLVDFDKDGGKDLVRREIEHWMEMDEEEPRDTFQHRAA